MNLTKWTDTYGIHHWKIIWSSYKILTWVAFEPTTTEFCSDALIDWAIRPWVQWPDMICMYDIYEHRTYKQIK